MQPPDERPEKKPKRLKRQLPPELEFLHELVSRPDMEPEELGPWARGFLKKLDENRELMRQHGIDADRIINVLQKPIEDIEQAQREADESQEQVLQSAADLGDSMRDFVDKLEALVQYAYEQQPFDPQVQDWKEMVEELRQEYAKIEE